MNPSPQEGARNEQPETQTAKNPDRYKDIPITVNYVDLGILGDKEIHTYRVEFIPVLDSEDQPWHGVARHQKLLGQTPTIERTIRAVSFSVKPHSEETMQLDPPLTTITL